MFMIIDKQIVKILTEVNRNNCSSFECNGFTVLIKTFDEGTKISLSTLVYQGDQFIPYSVRASISRGQIPTYHSTVRTSLSVIEKEYQVFLKYLGKTCHLTEESFSYLLEEFCYIAGKWRDYLDEKDRNDLVYARIR